MKNIESTNADSNNIPYYILFETDTEGVRQYKSASDNIKQGTCLSQILSDGIFVPAILMEVDKGTYEEYQREFCKTKDNAKREKRCIIRVPNPEYDGSHNKQKTIPNNCETCPYEYHHFFRPVKGNIAFSTLNTEDENGTINPFEPETVSDPLSANRYLELLEGLISYIKEKYPKYPDYAQFAYFLGQEYEIKEVAAIMKKPHKTLYGWRKKLRPIFDEYMQTVEC